MVRRRGRHRGESSAQNEAAEPHAKREDWNDGYWDWYPQGGDANWSHDWSGQGHSGSRRSAQRRAQRAAAAEREAAAAKEGEQCRNRKRSEHRENLEHRERQSQHSHDYDEPSHNDSLASPDRNSTSGSSQGDRTRPRDAIKQKMMELVCSCPCLNERDFDARIRQHFHAIYDESGGGGSIRRVAKLMDLMGGCLKGKERGEVKNWSGYLLTLLKKCEAQLAEQEKLERAWARQEAAEAEAREREAKLPTVAWLGGLENAEDWSALALVGAALQ